MKVHDFNVLLLGLFSSLGAACSNDTGQASNQDPWQVDEDACMAPACLTPHDMKPPHDATAGPDLDASPEEEEDLPWAVPEGMVFIPEGPFTMGVSKQQSTSSWFMGDGPPHEFYLSPYAIDRFEVTVAQYTECVEQGVCSIAVGTSPSASVCTYTLKAQYPINCVLWSQAVTYCSWLGKSLPTEAQWEKAARGPDSLLYPWGNSPEASCEYAVLTEDEQGSCSEEIPWTVGRHLKDISVYGVHDMLGNVSEWTLDLFDFDSYETNSYRDPTGPELSSVEFEERVLRGAAFSGIRFARVAPNSAARNSAPIGYSSNHTGFRCAYNGPDEAP